MKITKTTLNYALNRGLELDVDLDAYTPTVDFYEKDEHSEYMFSYRINEDGTLTWERNIYLREDIKEELPYHIRSEKELRAVIAFVSKELELN